MGFNKKWVKWVLSCVKGAKFSVLINDSPCDFFPSSRGVRQGDFLSPSFFIIMAESLSRLIAYKNSKKIWAGISIRSQLIVTHTLFVDDSLLFGKAILKEALVIMENLDEYFNASG